VAFAALFHRIDIHHLTLVKPEGYWRYLRGEVRQRPCGFPAAWVWLAQEEAKTCLLITIKYQADEVMRNMPILST
jgi:hypothetical protein